MRTGMKVLNVLAAFCLAFSLAACGDPSKAEIVKKAEGADTRDKLEKALGRPTDLKKLGPVETWTYKAKDGDVSFVITGNTVAMQATSDKKSN